MLFARTRALLPIFALLLSACAGGGGAAASTPDESTGQPAVVTTDDAAVSTRTALDALDSAPVVAGPNRAVFHSLGIHPDAKSPSFIIGSVGAGEAQGGVPCIDCVSGAQTGDNIGLSGPEAYVPTGATWQYTLSFAPLTIKGKCTMSWAIAAGTKVLDKFSAPVFTVSQDGGYYLYGINRLHPKYSGAAVMTGRVKCGATSQTSTAPLYFQ